MTDSIYWLLHGKNYKDAWNFLHTVDKNDLAAIIINERYNNFLARYADYNENEFPVEPNITNGSNHGKRLPYMGWYWRSINFADGKIPIGFDRMNDRDYVGFMANNKWDYHERYLTDDEFTHLMVLIDDAMRINEEGGDINELHRKKMAALETIYPWMQTLPRLV